jgi:selenocysteine-specific elongation factor
MKRVILGTAGHIDHGKSRLVKALTGIDTDRLKEEKQRGISIELGFAFLDLDADLRMGIVDVPGHEKFVRQMVAGSGGIDIAALVIALDEGVMPQTVEHLDILSLLDIKSGIIVLTKLDLVDEELALLAEDDAREAVKGTFLENAPVVKISSKTGEGLDELKTVLRELASKVEGRPVHGLLRLPVDRVFTLKGHGTVVTGTLISGVVSAGDEVELLPGGMKSRVRSLESHNRAEETAYPGERVAVNLRGLEQTEVHRGDVVAHPGEFKPSYIMDVKLKALARCPIALRNGKKVRLHHYTSEVEARLALPDMQELEPGTETHAQLRVSAPIVPAAGDHFVIRALSPSITLGGGVIINPRAVKLKARTAKAFLETEREDDSGIISALLKSSGITGVSRNELLGLSGLSAKRLDKVLEGLKNNGKAVRFDPTDNRLIHQDFYELIKGKILMRLKAFHNDQPLKEGISKQELRSTIPGSDKLFKKIMETLVAKVEVVDQGDIVKLASHKVELKEDEKGAKDKLLKIILDGGAAPPGLKEILALIHADQKQAKNLLNLLEREGKIVRIREDIFFSSAFVDTVKRQLAVFIKKEGGITPSQFSEITKSSRKYNIPLLEYFDREKFTMRVGDHRVLRGSGTSGEGGKAI